MTGQSTHLNQPTDSHCEYLHIKLLGALDIALLLFLFAFPSECRDTELQQMKKRLTGGQRYGFTVRYISTVHSSLLMVY